MDWQSVLSIVGVVIGLCALAISVGAFLYTRKQTQLMEEQDRARKAEEKDELNWSERFERLVSRLSRISRTLMIQPRGENIAIPLYQTIFSDPRFREALETYIVTADPAGGRLTPRNPRPDELRRKVLRDTIEKAEQCMQSFQEHHPNVDLKYYMG